MKIQNPSTHGSGVMLCIKKHNGRTNGGTNIPEAICLPNFFNVRGIIKKYGKELQYPNI